MKSSNNLVWIDLEMTGLNVETDVILEIATIITDSDLNEIAVGPEFVIHQPDYILDEMGPWCKEHHGLSGLTEAVKKSTITELEAETKTFEFIQQYCKENTALLAGSSIWQDRIFLNKYMPSIVNYMYYKMIDVTSIKELVNRWYPNHPEIKMEKKEAAHRALDDIRESIEVLRKLRKNFFCSAPLKN